MFCSKCHNPVQECECDDIDDRLEAISTTRNFVTDRCANCKEHRRDCTCDEYEPIQKGL